MSEAAQGTHQKLGEVDDDAVAKILPPGGFIHDYISYISGQNDAPLWFHLGATLTVLASTIGYSDIKIHASDGRIKTEPIRMWSALVGDSGDRKSAAINPILHIFKSVRPTVALPHDGTVEAWHEMLAAADRDGVGLFSYNELAWLFSQGKQTYKAGMNSWLLELYEGGPVEKLTKAKGNVVIQRSRPSILGGLPPETFRSATSREDWKSGFLNRFLYWSAKRTRYVELDTPLTAIAPFSQWVQRVVCTTPWNYPIIMPWEATKSILTWVKREIEDKRTTYNSDAMEFLTRFRDHAFRIAAVLAVADQCKTPKGPIKVEPRNSEQALKIVSLLKDSMLHVYAAASTNTEAALEKRVYEWVRLHPGSTVNSIAEGCSSSRVKVTALLNFYVNDDLMEGKPKRREGFGRRPKCYSIKSD